MPDIKRPLTMQIGNKSYIFNGHNTMYKWGYDCERRSGYQKHREYLLKKYKKCVYCGSNKELQIDHIHPVSRGGGDEIENLTIACQKCNQFKKAKMFYELDINFMLRF